MTADGNNKQAFAALALVALFFAVSFAASLHLAGHDTTGPQGELCSVCISASQLDSALVADDSGLNTDPASPVYDKPQIEDFVAAGAPAIRQRGPPEPLSI